MNYQVIRPLLLLLLLLTTVSSLMAQQAPKKLPNFQFEDLQGKIVKSSDIKYDKYLTVVYFDPDCEHCNKVTEGIVKNIDKFKNTKMVFISFGDKTQMATFQKKYFAGNKNVQFLHDKNMKIFDAFPDAIDTPTLYIYNKNKAFVAKIEHEPLAKDIYKYYK